MDKGFNLADLLKDVSNLDTIGDARREQIEYIKRDLIDSDPNNFYTLSGVDQLADNIATCGLQQPIRVRPNPSDAQRYMIVSGHRRNAAIEILAKDDPDHWQKIPCIVERDAASPALQQLRLIYANANTRAMTSAELGEQAAQVEKLLYQLKEDGYEFPGRMRDHVAEACNASRTKLARIRVIRSSLIPQFMRLWEGGKLSDDTADVLAHQMPFWQEMIYREQTKRGDGFSCTAGHVRNIVSQMETLRKQKISCEKNFGNDTCTHISCRIAKAADLGPYGHLYCNGCCCSCFNLLECTFSCPYAADEKKRCRDEKREENREQKAKKAIEEAPQKQLLSNAYQLVGRIRAEKGISPETFLKTSQRYYPDSDLEKLRKAESGSNPGVNTRMPGGVWPNDVQNIIATADLLGISIDEMYGHKAPAQDVSVSKPDECSPWKSGKPDTVGIYAVMYLMGERKKAHLTNMSWDGTKWMSGLLSADSMGIEILSWVRLPEEVQ